MKKLLIAFLLFFSLNGYATDIEGTRVLLRGVDKITGRTSTGEAPVGKATMIKNIRITPQRCLKKPPEEVPENAAFLLIEEKTNENDFTVIFNGWMFSSNPALSAMEHPIFDIWVLECLTDDKPNKTWENQQPDTKPKPLQNEVKINELEEI